MDKNNDESSTPRRKHRFIPKAPARRKRGVPPPDDGDGDAGEAEQAQTLYRQFNESLGRRGPKGEKKSPAKVASASRGDTPTTYTRRFGPAKEESGGGNRSRSGDAQIPTLPSAANEAGKDVIMEDATNVEPLQKVNKQDTPIWDYENTYYPTTLPLRKPNSEDPVLNEKDNGVYGEKEYDESTVNPASELGLLDEREKEKMFFFQFPSMLPLVKRSATAKGKEKVGSSTSVDSTGAPKKGCSLEELSAGCMGKMLVYKSGAVKLKLGDVLYDVSPGSDCVFAQDVAAISSAKNECCVLGELKHRMVLTPNVDSLLKVVINLD